MQNNSKSQRSSTGNSSHAANRHSAATLPGFVEQYDRFLAVAQRLPAEQVRHAKTNVGLAILNATRGIAALMAHRAEVTALPGISMVQIDSLPMMGQALQYAAVHVVRFLPVTPAATTTAPSA